MLEHYTKSDDINYKNEKDKAAFGIFEHATHCKLPFFTVIGKFSKHSIGFMFL